VCEVDQLEDAVDERVPQRDERVERAVREPDQEDAEPLLRRLHEVYEEPGADKSDERQPQHGRDVLRRPAPVCHTLCVGLGRHVGVLLKRLGGGL
jgi:hypothetical protein